MKLTKRVLSMLLALVMMIGMLPVSSHAAQADAALTASLAKAKTYIDGITINNSSNDPEKVVKNFKTHFTWDNEKRESNKSYLFDWSYYNGVVFEGIEYVYEVTGESAYKDYVLEYMSSMITSSGGWAACSNNSSKQCAGYNATHGADCYMTAALLLDCYEMTGDSRYLTMAKTLYADLDSAANSYLLKNAGYNYRHTWSSDPSPDLWLDGLYMILPFRAEYAKHIGDQEELDLIVSRMQWVSDNMYNSSKGLFYHAADSASANSGTYWLRSIGWYAAAIVDIMDSMEGENLEAMKHQLKKLVDGMKACQNPSNGMWLNNMNASHSSSNPYETSGTALTCYAVMKAVNNGWLDESYADMAILAFNGICNEKLSGSNLKDICFKGAPGSSNSTFYDNEGKGVGPFIMFYAEMLEYVNKPEEEPEVTEPTVPEEDPEVTKPTVPEEEENVYTGIGNLTENPVYTLDSDGINSGEKYLIVYSGKALENNSGVDNNPAVTVSNNTITLSDDSKLAWTITQSSGGNYYVENNGSYVNLSASGNDPIGSGTTVYISRSGSKYIFRNASGSGAYLRYSDSQLFCAGTSNSNNGMYLYRRTGSGTGAQVILTLKPDSSAVKRGSTLALNAAVTVGGQNVDAGSCTITWSSSDNAVATVSKGVVTGVAAGNAVITATLTKANGTDLKSSIVLTVPVTVQGHEYQSHVTAPTCTQGGYTTYTCTICGDSYVADEVAALGHDLNSVVTEATCTTPGFTTHTCRRCGEVTEDGHVDALGHDNETVTVEPTCTKDGLKTEHCTRCGESTTQVLPALGHKYDAVTVNATCTASGTVTYACVCGDTYTEVIPALGHKYEAVVTAPTCTEKGFTTYTCACGDAYMADEVDALGHSYTSKTTEPTCDKDGSIVYTCICGDTYTEVIPALGHQYEAVVTSPTCTEGGYTTYTCACGHSYVSDRLPALGHRYTTTEQNGVLIYTCGGCGHSYTESAAWTAVGTAYVLDTDGIDVGSEHHYIVVGADNDYALTLNDTTVGCAPVTISNNTIFLDDASVYEFYFAANGSEKKTYLLTRDGSRSIYHVSGNINYGHDSKGYWYFGSASNGQYQLYDKDGQNWYLNYGYVWANQSVSRFAVSSNARTVRLFKEFDTYARLTGALLQTVSDTDNVTIEELLRNVTIQLSSNGTDVTGTDTVTADMLDWYTDFDATLAGTYTANVFYQEVIVGSITITVTTNHCYEATVVDPTCTEFGYTEVTCTDCGVTHRYDYTNPMGHSYTYADSGNQRIYTCVRCGDSYSESLTLSCRQVSTFTSGNRFVIAIKSGGKYYAMSHGGNCIRPVQISVINGEITTGVTDDLLWSYHSGKLSYVKDGTTFYLNLFTSGWWYWNITDIGISTRNAAAVSFHNNKLQIGSLYLRYSNSTFSVDSAYTAAYIFKAP